MLENTDHCQSVSLCCKTPEVMGCSISDKTMIERVSAVFGRASTDVDTTSKKEWPDYSTVCCTMIAIWNRVHKVCRIKSSIFYSQSSLSCWKTARSTTLRGCFERSREHHRSCRTQNCGSVADWASSYNFCSYSSQGERLSKQQPKYQCEFCLWTKHPNRSRITVIF